MFNTIKVNNTDTDYTHSIFDISDYNSGATYNDLSAALAAIPESKLHGGMTVCYETDDNKYVQFRLMKSTWSIDTTNWADSDNVYNKEEIDEKVNPIINKTKNITSGGLVTEEEAIVLATNAGKEVTKFEVETKADASEVVEFNGNDGDTFAKVGKIGDKKGVFVANLYDLDGKPVIGFELDTENDVMIIGERKYKLIPYIETI